MYKYIKHINKWLSEQTTHTYHNTQENRNSHEQHSDNTRQTKPSCVGGGEKGGWGGWPSKCLWNPPRPKPAENTTCWSPPQSQSIICLCVKRINPRKVCNTNDNLWFPGESPPLWPDWGGIILGAPPRAVALICLLNVGHFEQVRQDFGGVRCAVRREAISS